MYQLRRFPWIPLVLGICILGICVATELHAATATQVHVNLRGKCKGLGEVFLIQDGKEGDPIPMAEKSLCEWTAKTGASYSTKRSFFSLRIDNWRTECHAAGAEEIKEFEFAGVIDINCCSKTKPRRVSTETNPAMKVLYLRALDDKPRQAYMRSEPRACIERGTFENGAGDVQQVQFDDERIYLQLGTENGLMGLRVSDIPKNKPDAVRVFNRDRIVYERIEQKSAQHLSPNAIEADRSLLQRLRFERLSLTVK